MTDKQVADMQAATDAANAAQDAADARRIAAESVDTAEDISMEEVLGAGGHKKPVAAEDVDVPVVESQTV
jgi:hypothetical protein